MTFAELIDFVLEMSGNIPKDAKIITETFCNGDRASVYKIANSVRYDSKDNAVVISYKRRKEKLNEMIC